MPTVRNKTRNPVSIALPGGKTLRLGPALSGRISPKAAESQAIAKMVAAGKVEVEADGASPRGGHAAAQRAHGGSETHGSGGPTRRSGDR